VRGTSFLDCGQCLPAQVLPQNGVNVHCDADFSIFYTKAKSTTAEWLPVERNLGHSLELSLTCQRINGCHKLRNGMSRAVPLPTTMSSTIRFFAKSVPRLSNTSPMVHRSLKGFSRNWASSNHRPPFASRYLLRKQHMYELPFRIASEFFPSIFSRNTNSFKVRYKNAPCSYRPKELLMKTL